MASPDEQRSGLSDAAGRAALFPARAAARLWRDQPEAAADDVLSAPEIARVLDRALAGSLPEELARSLVRHRVLERVPASEETQHALRQVASSPELRDAMRRRTAGLADEVVGGVRASAVRLDGRVEHAVSRREPVGRPAFAGIATRALALATDAIVTTALCMAVVGVVAIVVSLVGGLGPDWLVGALLSVGWTVVAGMYFVLFWSTTGRTPGCGPTFPALFLGTVAGFLAADLPGFRKHQPSRL